MLSLPVKEVDFEEELLTPCHSIPFQIHSSEVSGSQGHTFNCKLETILAKSPKKPSDPIQRKSNSPPRAIISRYSVEKKEKLAKELKIERKLSKEESFELFGRLDKITDIRRDRLKKKSPDSCIKLELCSKSRQNSIDSAQKEKTSARSYGYKTRAKEEFSPPEVFSNHFRVHSEISKFSSPSKEVTFLISPPQPSNRAKHKTSKSIVLHSSNTPDKIISKIQNLLRNK